MIPRFLLTVLAACAFIIAPLHAASQELQVDHAASKVGFVAKATMHSFEGWIEKWDLELTVPEGAELPDVVVFKGDGATMTTDHKKRDEEMHRWMEHETKAPVVFRLTKFSGTPDARIAEGELTLHGTTTPISFPITLRRDGAKLTVTGDAVVDVTNFGLSQFRKFGMLTVDTQVKVSLSVTGTLE
jgi:polyisoprenoid-binding protein YceI